MSDHALLSPAIVQEALSRGAEGLEEYCNAVLADESIPAELRARTVALLKAPSAANAFATDSQTTGPVIDHKGSLQTAAAANRIRDGLAVGPGQTIYQYRDGVWSIKDDEVQARLVRLLGDDYRRSHVVSVRDAVMHHSGTPHIASKPSSEFINTRSGLYHWRTGEMKPHSADALSTIQIPVRYDPEATCPNTDAWLAQVLEPDVIPVVWEVLGYLCMTGNPHQVAVLLYGPGGTGKSTFLKLVEALIGTHNRSTASYTQLTGDRFVVAQLHGKLANLCGDITGSFKADTSIFKALTGEDAVTVQHKYQQPFDMLNFAVPVFSTNEFWPSSDTSTGFFDRWLVLPFLRPVSGVFDESVLHAETAGIFNKAMEALRGLEARGGKRAARFTQSPSVAAVKDEMRAVSDSVFQWLQEDEGTTQDPTVMSTRKSVYNRYLYWCSHPDLGGDVSPLGNRKFWQRMHAAGYVTDHKSNGTRYVIGLQVQGSYVPTYS